jgi:succinylglutamate desuccinylase
VWRRGKPALTLELGEAGFHEPATSAASEAVYRLIQLFEVLRQQDLLIPSQKTACLDTIQAARKSPLSHYRTVHREPYSTSELRLRPGIINFHEVLEGELLSMEGTPELRAPFSGRILFPKYPRRDSNNNIYKSLPKEIYRIIQAS